jgi:hypothetical protein
MSNQDWEIEPELGQRISGSEAETYDTIHAGLRKRPHKHSGGVVLLVLMFALLFLAILFWPRN